MRIVSAFVVLMVMVAMTVPGFAEERRLKDKAELSYVDTGGNSEVTTLSAKNTLKYAFTEKVLGTWGLAVLSGKSDGETDAENYWTELRGDYLFSERLYSYGALSWFKDRFARIDARYTLSAGAGYKFLLGPKHHLLGEAGLTYTVEHLDGDDDRSYPGGRLFGRYDYSFSEKSKFTQSLELLSDFEETANWLLNSETALESALNSFLSLKASYGVKYDNRPTAGVDDTDTILAVALAVDF